MDCPTCKTSNPPEAGFCMKCGSALTHTCPQCGTELPAESQFCYKCGHRLDGTQPEEAQDRLQQYIPKELLAKLDSARSGGGMQGERRVVTMLFCDVQGSTAAAERLDPEEWAEIMNGAFEHLITPVYQYEGTLARLMGDAVLAFFGAPIAHEDDPQRAILAGLEIIKSIAPYRDEVKQQWDLDFNVRIGINTGLVVVGEVGTDLRVEYTAMGDAVNLAARMEQTAEPGTVRVTENTYRQVAPLFDVESLGPVEVKGKAEPVPAFRVLGAKATPGRLRGIEGLDAPLVGRDREMDQLREAISALAEGRGQILSLMGEAGLGKSRLMAELRQSLVSDGLLIAAGNEPGSGGSSTTINWHEGRSLSYQTSVPYGPFVDMLSNIMGLRADQTDTEKYDRIKEKVSAVVASELVLDVAPFVATVLGVSLEDEEAERTKYLTPPQMRGKVFTAIGRYIEALVAERATVLVFEDLHWIDPTSLELLEQLLPLTDRVALTIIALFRPVRQEPSWRFHEVAVRDFGHRYTTVQLEPLDSDSSRTLVAHLLEVDDLPEKVRDLILAKTEGNPFFVEEVIRSLLDAGLVVKQDGRWRATQEIEKITVPDTLAGVITARVDRLDEESRRVIQTASVIGREFQLGTLADIYPAPESLESALTDLQRRELVREKSRIPQPVYTFKHALTQDTVYASILLSRRRELNLQVAESLERSDPEQANDIARHFVEAREPARALPYLVQAGERAARSYSTPEAIGLFTQALDIIGTTGDVEIARRAYEGLGGALTFGGDVPRAVDTYDQMLHFAQDHAEVPMQVSALNKLGFVTALLKGQFPEAEEHLHDAERLAHESNDLPGLAELHVTYCYMRTSIGDFEGALDHQSESAQIGHALDMEEPRLFGMTHMANTMTYMTRFEEAWQQAQEARRLAEEAGNQRYLSELLAFAIPTYHVRNGDFDEALKSAEEATNIAMRIGAMDSLVNGVYIQGQIALLKGEYQQAIALQHKAVEAAEMSGFTFLQAMGLCALGTAYLDVSMELADRTVEYHDKAVEFLEMPLGNAMGAAAWAELGHCLLKMGDPARADEFFQKGLNVSTARKYLMRPRLLIGSALVALARKDLDSADKLVMDAREFAEERGMKHLYAMVDITEASVNSARGETKRALENLDKAEEVALGMQMRPAVVEARAVSARLLATAGRTAEAEAKLVGARRMVDEIAGLFKDEALRDLYIQSAVSNMDQSS